MEEAELYRLVLKPNTTGRTKGQLEPKSVNIKTNGKALKNGLSAESDRFKRLIRS